MAMGNRFSLALFGISLVALHGCQSCGTRDEMTAVLVQEWFPYSGYAGEVVAMYESAPKLGLKFTVQQGADNIDPIALVRNGSAGFGVVAADRLMQSTKQGDDLVVVGVVNAQSPTVFITMANSGIETPMDFVGKRVGILPGTNTELIYRLIKRGQGLDTAHITELDVPFELMTFIGGEYDVRPAFVYDEPVTLDSEGLKYHLIRPSDYGVSFLGTVYFTRRELIKSNPDLVQLFVSALRQGWKSALADPGHAISLLKKYDPNIDEQRELRSLTKGMPYFAGDSGRVLYASKEHWVTMSSELESLGAIDTFNYDKAVDYSFLLRSEQTELE